MARLYKIKLVSHEHGGACQSEIKVLNFLSVFSCDDSGMSAIREKCVHSYDRETSVVTLYSQCLIIEFHIADFSDTDIMGEMTSPSTLCSAALSTNQISPDLVLQSGIVAKHDFGTSDTDSKTEPVKQKQIEYVCTEDTNITANQRFDENTLKNIALNENRIDASKNMCNAKTAESHIASGSFVQIYHVGEGSRDGYFETVQVVSSGDDAIIKVNTPLTIGVDVTSGNAAMQRDFPVARTEDCVPLTTTGTCSSSHRASGRFT